MTTNHGLGDDEHATGRRWLLGAVAVSAAAAGLAVALRNGAMPGDQRPADDFWSRQFVTPEGAAWTAAPWRQQRVLVNFWATWCPPCVDELPLIDRYYKLKSSKSGHFLALALDKPEAVRQFLARYPLAMPVAIASEGGIDLAKSLGNLAGGLPFTVFFGAGGAVERTKMGVLTEADLSAWIS